MASIGPPSLGTMTVVFATMDSFPCKEKHTVGDSNTDMMWDFSSLLAPETGVQYDQPL